ncbi:hypothetical protein [Bosea sp. 685]|uniref:hypothetical protein n=1 Tax=Bosea sp. 685 TaxID=3080057 RepID=UPI0028936541|nr:hypothetical protein [Bosea sp. 685]WNJ89894.1 hypothetical protein RMR04_26470 [Bosea sp. 685]
MTSGVVTAEDRQKALPRLLGAPVFWLAVFLLLVLCGLALPLRLPLGPNYWDTDVYLDAIHRIRLGQVPSNDFFAPVGPLGYYLAAGLAALFPQAQPMLLVNWALLPVALPVLAALVIDVQRGSRNQALALVLPFLIFALLPINLHSLYPAPGFDGFGHYNRHIALLLYLLVAILLFVRNRGLLTGLVAVLMLTLFLVKITGAVAGALLVGYALIAGRLRLREALLAAAAVLVALGLLDLATGVVRAYLHDILILVSLNTGTLLPRFLTVASVKFNVVGPGLALICALFVAAWRDGTRLSLAGACAVVASPLGWFMAVFAALAFFETQNTGSLEFIGLWPVLLLVLMQWRARRGDALRPIVLVLALAVTLPSLVIVVERAARALLGAPAYVELAVPDLGPLGRVSLKPEYLERGTDMLEHYAAHQQTYRDLTLRGVLPSSILFSEIDYQATWLMEVQQAVSAIRAWEASNSRRLEGIFTLDFVDPVNHLLGRAAPRHVPIGIDPTRTNPAVTPEALEALRATDAILAPKCPPTPARLAIATHFAAALEGRKLVALAPCWDMYVKP